MAVSPVVEHVAPAGFTLCDVEICAEEGNDEVCEEPVDPLLQGH